MLKITWCYLHMLESGALRTKWKDALVFHRPHFTSSLTHSPSFCFSSDGDGSQDHLLPVCMDTDCKRSEIYLAKPGETEVHKPSVITLSHSSIPPFHLFASAKSVSSQSCCEDSDRTVLNIVSLSLLKVMDRFERWIIVRAGRSYRFPDLIWLTNSQFYSS